MIKYYLIPAYEIEALEKERVQIHKIVENITDEKMKWRLPVMTPATWRITHRRWKIIKLWNIYK
jgi:hypothetical protein